MFMLMQFFSFVPQQNTSHLFTFNTRPMFGDVPNKTPADPLSVRYEVFTAVTMKNGVFWDVTLCGSCRNRRFGGT
jgi:hypothetical protein